MIAFLAISFVTIAHSALITYHDLEGKPYEVASDDRAILINGTRTMLLSGAIHYTRSTPAMWKDLMIKAKQQGLNCIQTYTFWNFHEHERGQYKFVDQGNVSLFLETAAEVGLFVNFRIGPYVCAEWNYGGLPVWLNWEEGIKFRTYNEPWMKAVKNFMDVIVEKIRPFLAENGGPVILAQVENEYHPVDDQDKMYVNWCGELALSYNLHIPWVMCNGASANGTINTCNANDCWDYAMAHNVSYPGQPLMWTENEGWFSVWTGYRIPARTARDLSYSVAEWIAAGGAYHNYYMWYGGNNYGLWAASGVTTMYANEVLLRSDGTLHEPNFSHLGKLQEIVGKYADVIINNPINVQPLAIGSDPNPLFKQFVSVFGWGPEMIIFLINRDHVSVSVQYLNKAFLLPPQSVIIVDSDLEVLYNTAVIETPNQERPKQIIQASNMKARFWAEPVGMEPRPLGIQTVTSIMPQEQLYLTQDRTAYVIYQSLVSAPLTSSSILTVDTQFATGLVVLWDGEMVGEWSNGDHQGSAQTAIIELEPQSPSNTTKTEWTHILEIVSSSIGISNKVNKTTKATKGITGKVIFDDEDITTGLWKHQIGLSGEFLSVFSHHGSLNVTWTERTEDALGKPLVWFQITIKIPSVSMPHVTLFDATGLTRGFAYVNGKSIGRYWPTTGVQSLYYIPPDYLVNGTNVLTLIEEVGATDLSTVGIVLVLE
jgi:hypothetical protein